jgi:hypothetical protein
MKNEIIKIFMEREEMTIQEAKKELKEMKNRVLYGENPEDVLLEYCLECDYIFDLLF